MQYEANKNRYETMQYQSAPKTGLKLPLISLGMWHNFGAADSFENARAIVREAFDRGITYFDLANNYGNPNGSAETTFGNILREDLLPYRDEMIITTKVGYDMWEGPYGIGGTRKHIAASVDQSLKRLGVDYVDILYSHRYDQETPLEETLEAFHQIVKQGKALYIGFSTGYEPAIMEQVISLSRSLRIPSAFHMSRYSMFNRQPELELHALLQREGMGCLAFSPLAEGALTNKYLQQLPPDSRASKGKGNTKNYLKEENLVKIRKLNELAALRGQSLAQLAISWVLRDGRVQSALIGASKPSQVRDCSEAVRQLKFTQEELALIKSILI